MTVGALARELGTTDRTLRRLADTGAIRSKSARGGPRRAIASEESYLRDHWALLRSLRAALRTEPRVTAALLFGSTARGDDGPGSDVDLIVAVEGDPSLTERVRLGNRIAQKTGRRVDLFILADLLVEPKRLGPILAEARPIVDRAHVWPRLQSLMRGLTRARARPRSRKLTLR